MAWYKLPHTDGGRIWRHRSRRLEQLPDEVPEPVYPEWEPQIDPEDWVQDDDSIRDSD